MGHVATLIHRGPWRVLIARMGSKQFGFSLLYPIDLTHTHITVTQGGVFDRQRTLGQGEISRGGVGGEEGMLRAGVPAGTCSPGHTGTGVISGRGTCTGTDRHMPTGSPRG